MANRHTTFLLRLGLGLAVLGILIFAFDPREVARTLASSRPQWIALAAVLCLVVLLIRVWRWRFLLRDLGIDQPFGRLLRIYFVGMYFNTFLPGGLGGDAYRVYALSRVSSKTIRPLAATIIERFTGIAALAILCMMAIVLTADSLPFPKFVLMAVTAGVLGIAALALAMLIQGDRILPRLQSRLPAKLQRRLPAEKIAAISGVSRDIRARPVMFVRTFAIGLAMSSLVIIIYWVIGRALSDALPLRYVAVFFPLIDLTSMVPVTVNGIGLKEGLAIFFLQRVGLTPAFSLSLSILYRIIDAGFAVVGGLFFMTDRNAGSPRIEDAAAVDSLGQS